MNLPDVSRETLQEYVSLIKKWNKTINLVSRNDLDNIWSRHVEDCFELIGHIPMGCQNILDIGSGSGLPGLVIAIVRREANITLVEVDRRKSMFLREAVRALGLTATVLTSRIESLENQQSDIITTRAFASVDKTIELSQRQLLHGPELVLLKGRGVQSEIQEAKRKWDFNYSVHPSQAEGCILKMHDIKSRTHA